MITMNNWAEYREKVIRPVWKIFRQQYERVGLEYGDFVSISYIILKKELEKYDPSKSGVYTYSINVLKRRMGDYIRNNYDTDKTRANYCPTSLNAPVSESEDVEMGDMIVDPRSVYTPENDVDKIKKFYRTLSEKQKSMLLLKVIGLEPEEIQVVMDITPTEYLNNMQKIKSPRRVSKLKKEVI